MYLELGCEEYIDESGFVFCSHLSNTVLTLDLNKDKGLINFLYDTCHLKKPCYDFNKIANIIKYLYNKHKVINEDKLHKIQLFFHLYRKFGIYLKLKQ